MRSRACTSCPGLTLIRRIPMWMLQQSGHIVVYAPTVDEAMRRFEKECFGLVISDLGLPDESGLVLMRKLRELRPGLQGICLSGYGIEADLEASREAGFGEHLTKPVEMQRLRAAVRRVTS